MTIGTSRIMVSCVVAAATLAGCTSDVEASAGGRRPIGATSGTTSRAPGDRFVPPTRSEGDIEVMPITFTDGRRIELRYPRDLHLARLGFGTGGSVSWPVRPEPYRCCGKIVSVSSTTAHAVYGRLQPIKTYRGVRNRRVRFYHGSETRGLNLDSLVFQFGPWMVEVYDVRRRGDFEDRMTDKERATWARSLDGRLDKSGYLVLVARSPLKVEPFANAKFGRPGADRYLLIEDGACGRPESDTATPRRVPDRAGTGAAWCDPATGLHVYVGGPAAFVDALVGRLGLRALPSAPR